MLRGRGQFERGKIIKWKWVLMKRGLLVKSKLYNREGMDVGRECDNDIIIYLCGSVYHVDLLLMDTFVVVT